MLMMMVLTGLTSPNLRCLRGSLRGIGSVPGVVHGDESRLLRESCIL